MINDLSGGIPCKYETYVLKFPQNSVAKAQINDTLKINPIFIFSISERIIFQDFCLVLLKE